MHCLVRCLPSHSLSCLHPNNNNQKNIRHAYNELLVSHPGQKQLIDQHHIYHCLDILRQDIMCRPDDTPMPTTQERHKIGDGQERKCKDWNALITWTQNSEREACFRMFSDYRRMHTLEQFAFCNEESKYRKTMVEYFEKHGHKPMFLDEDKDMKGSEVY